MTLQLCVDLEVGYADSCVYRLRKIINFDTMNFSKFIRRYNIQNQRICRLKAASRVKKFGWTESCDLFRR